MRTLLWIPLPPPFAGPEVASERLAAAVSRRLEGIVVENATVRAENRDKGKLDAAGLVAFARAYRRFLRGVARADTVYLVLAANVVGSLRDAALIGTARLLGRRVIVHLRGASYAGFYRDAPAPVRLVVGAAWRAAARAIVQTPGLRGLLAEAAPGVPVSVLPNGLPEEHLPARRTYAPRPRTLLFVGHLIYSKGFHDLVAVFRELRARHPDLALLCAGERPRPDPATAAFLDPARRADYLANRDRICEEINRFLDGGEREGVRYAGLVSGPAKAALFAEADVFVLPSYMEGFSVAILEAFFAGLPVVASTAGGTPDVVADGVNGFVVSPGDRAALRARLERLLDDGALAERMGRRNACEARARYGLDAIAARFAEILEGDGREGRSSRS